MPVTKTKDGKWKPYPKSPQKFKTRKEAVKRLREVEYFKHQKKGK